MKSIRELFDTEEKQYLLDHVNDAVFVVDLAGVIVWANPELFRRIGKTEDDLIGKTPDEWLSTRDGNITAAAAIDECLKSGSFRFQPKFVSDDGVRHMSDVSLKLIRDESGEPIGVISISRDVSDIVRLENELLQAQKTALIGELAGGVAHDINNTLAVILGNLELVQDEVTDSGLLDLISNAISAVHRGASVTHRLLAYARKQPLDPSSLKPIDVLREVDALMSPLLGRLHEVETVVGGGLWSLVADERQLQTVLMNLLINARDASPNGGKISVEAFNARLDDEYAKRNSEVFPGQYVCFAVSDNGTGIPAAHLDKVFDPFFTTKAVGQGSGLGLSMAYGFAKKSKGHLKIYSEVGVGTTVKLYLPRSYPNDQKADIIHNSQTATPMVGATVFVLEDNIDLLELTVSKLQKAGCSAISAASIEEAIAKKALFEDVDVFLLDVLLPGSENGKDFANELVQMGFEKPVLFMSGYTENAVVHHGIIDKDASLLQKPFTFEQLISALKNVISGKKKRSMAS
jgi:PAS domain S-box-containing protein